MENKFSNLDKETHNVVELLNKKGNGDSSVQTGSGFIGSHQTNTTPGVQVTAQLQQQAATNSQMQQQNQLYGASSLDQEYHGPSQDSSCYQNNLQSGGNQRPSVHHLKRQDGQDVKASFGTNDGSKVNNQTSSSGYDVSNEKYILDNDSGNDNDQGDDKYEGSFAMSQLGSTMTISADENTIPLGSQEVNTPSNNQSMSSGSPKDEIPCLASDLAWQHFSIVIFLPSGKKIAEYPNISNADPVCFQYGLSENCDEITSRLKIDAKYSFQVGEELLKVQINCTDQDDIDEYGMELKKKLIRLVNNMYKCREVKIPQRYQEYVFPHLQKVRQLMARDILLFHWKEDVFKLAGKVDVIEKATESVSMVVEDAKRLMEQKSQEDEKVEVASNDTDKIVMNISPNQIEIVRNLMQFPNVSLKYLVDGIEISGLKAEVHLVQKELQLNLAQAQCSQSTIPLNIGQFIWNHKDYVERSLKRKNIKCIWSLPRFSLIVVEALTKEEADYGSNEIEASVKIDNITKPSREMHQFLNRYQNQITYQKMEGMYEIVMTDDIYDEFRRVKMMDEKPEVDTRMEFQQNDDMETEERIPLPSQYGFYFSRFVIEEMIKFSKKLDVNCFMKDENEIRIQGKSSSTIKVKQKVMEIIDELESNEDTCKSSQKHTHFETMRKNTEDKKRCLITIKPMEKPEIMHARLTEHLVNVTTVYVGPIEQANADVIICPVRNDLLPIGVGSDIFNAGNPKKIQVFTLEYMEHPKSHRIEDGHIASVVASGRLQCQHLALTVWPLFSDIRYLDVNSIQKMAEKLTSLVMDTGSRTLAFPLFVSKAEIDVEVACLFLDRFRKAIGSVGLPHNVHLLFYADKKSTGDIFIQRSAAVFPRKSAFECNFRLAVEKKTWKKEMKPKPLDVQIFKGSIAEVDNQVEAIVNSTTYTLELDKGFVSALLLKKAGYGIQQECNTAHTKGIQFGGLAVTGSGELKCKAIFHIALYKWITDGEFSSEMLKLVVRRCLHEAESRKFKSIAFPALGAGNLQYPTYLVARTMQETIREFSLENQPVNLEKVLIVLYQGDRDVIEAFEKTKSSIESTAKGSGGSASRKNVNEFPAKYMMAVHKVLGIKIMLAAKECYENLRIKEARLVLGEKSFDAAASSPKWEEKNNCFTFNMNTDGSASAIKDALKKTIDGVLDMKHQIVDVFLLSNGIQKQIETVIKVVTEKVAQILSCSTRGKKSATSQPVCYVKMIRLFMSAAEYRDIESKKMDKSSKDSDFSPWQVYEMETKDKLNQLKLEVFGHKTDVKETLQSLKENIEKTVYEDQAANYQWYLCGLDNKRERPINPRLNDVLNRAVDMKEQCTHGIMDDEEHEFDLDNMECLNSKGRRVYNLKCKERKVGTTSTQSKSDQGARSLPEKPSPLPGKAVRTASEGGKAMLREISSENDEDMVRDVARINQTEDQETIFTSITCEIKEEYMWKARQIISKLKAIKYLEVHEGSGKFKISGSLDSVDEANKMLISEDIIKRDKGKTDESEKYFTDTFSMTDDEYAGLVYFSNEETWFTSLKKHEWKDGEMKYMVKKRHMEETRQCIKSKVDSMRLMGESEIILTIPVSDTDFNPVQQYLLKEGNASCYFSYDNQRIKIKAENYEKAQQVKYMIEVKLGITKQTGNIRKRRKFASNDPDYTKQSTDNVKDREDFSRTVVPKNKPFDTARISISSDNEFYTKEGLKVLVYKGDILNLPVDCIVNAANEDLQHGGGVAFFIAQAAGYRLLDESNDYIQRNGPLPVGTCCSTTAGNLKHYHCVIHTVGPRWHSYKRDEKLDCLRDLKQSIISAIEEAAGRQLKSIAIPSISSGIFAVPKDLCAQEYFRAVEEFSKNSFSRSSIKEIHFVDKDAGMCSIVEDTFKKCLNQSGKTTGRTFNRSLSEKAPSTDDKLLPTENNPNATPDKKRVARKDRILSNQFVFNFEDKISVKLVKGDISNCTTHVIVCPQDEKLQSYGKIAKAIHSKASEIYKDPNAYQLKITTLNIGDVLPLKTSVSVHWNYVFHVVPPRWGLNSSRDPQLFERNIEKVVFNLLLKTEDYSDQIQSVAIPLLGVSMDEAKYPTPLPTCVRGMANGIMKYAQKRNNKLDVEVWGFDDGVMSIMRETFNAKANPAQLESNTTGRGETNFNSSRYQTGQSAENFNRTVRGNADRNIGNSGSYTGDTDKKEDLGKTLKVDTIKGENCCICMDSITNPKRLQCGHIFCKECIDLAFTHKKACPSCGRVYGKLTGNQPKGGSLSKFVDKYKDLEGYEGCGHIKINYYIPGGIQTDEHPNPGKYYEGITRPAYLPNNEKGKLVASLLELAFKQRLIFTIGQSRTSGHEGVVTWNDIHHKTRMEGGPARFGYPDPTYLDRVLDELAAKGITKDSLEDK